MTKITTMGYGILAVTALGSLLAAASYLPAGTEVAAADKVANPPKIVPALAQEQVNNCAIGNANLINENNYIEMMNTSLDKRNNEVVKHPQSFTDDALAVFVGDTRTLLDHIEIASRELHRLRGWCVPTSTADALQGNLDKLVRINQPAYDGLRANLEKARRIAFEQWAQTSRRP
jgi:hypothetical protein